MGRHLSPRYGQWYWSADTLFWQLSIDHNNDVQSVFSWVPKVVRTCESRHWLSCGADGRSVYGHVITKFLGWVDLLCYGAPPTRAWSSAIMAELRGRSAPAKHHWYVNLPIPENLVITWPYTARPSAPQGNQCSISHFLASLGAQEDWYCTHIAHQCCDQLTAVKTGYLLTSITWPYRGLRCRSIEVEYFLKLSADKLLVFKWLQAQV